MNAERKFDPKHTAVIVVDMQNDFCSPEGAYAQSLPGLNLDPVTAMVPRLQRFLDDARGYGAQVIYVTAIYNSDDNRYLSPVWLEHAERRRSGLYTTIPLCQEGSWGAEVIPELAPREGELIVRKHRYSAFIDTPLQAYLRNADLGSICVTGVGTNGCVESTARDGFMLDHFTATVSDCVATYWEDAHLAALNTLELLFGEVLESRAIVEAWSNAAGDRDENKVLAS